MCMVTSGFSGQQRVGNWCNPNIYVIYNIKFALGQYTILYTGA